MVGCEDGDVRGEQVCWV